MAELVKQPTMLPTRKIWAVIISGGITSSIIIGVSYVAPDFDTTALGETLRTGIEVGLVWGISSFSGWWTKRRGMG